jgi:hypothetical protein
MDQVSLAQAAKRGSPPYETSRSARTGYWGGEMGSHEPILRGQDENAPFRALNLVFLVVAVAVVLVGVVAYVLWSALN